MLSETRKVNAMDNKGATRLYELFPGERVDSWEPIDPNVAGLLYELSQMRLENLEEFPTEVILKPASRISRDRYADFPHITSSAVLGMRNRAEGVLRPVLESAGAFRDARTIENERLTLFYPTQVIDILEAGSNPQIAFEFDRTRMRGYRIKSNVPLPWPAIFRAPFGTGTPDFVTEEFVELVRRENLIGLAFNLIWDSTWTEPPINAMLVRATWGPAGWSETERAERFIRFINRLAQVDPDLGHWLGPGYGSHQRDRKPLILDPKPVARAMTRVKGEMWRHVFAHAPENLVLDRRSDMDASLSPVIGRSREFELDPPWANAVNLHLYDLMDKRTRFGKPEGVLELFRAFRDTLPVEFLVISDIIFPDWMSIRKLHDLGWITWIVAQGDVADRDPDLPEGARLLSRERGPDAITIQLTERMEEVTVEHIKAARAMLEAQGWLLPRIIVPV